MNATFKVENVNALQAGLKLEAVFTQLGGFIGSGEDNTWQIQDNEDAISEIAARITTQGQNFTIEALNGAEVRINEARSAIPTGRPVILSDKDRIRLGNLNILLLLPTRYGDEIRIDTYGSMRQIIGGGKVEDVLVVNGDFVIAGDFEAVALGTKSLDPINALERQTFTLHSQDPIAAFEKVPRETAQDNSINVLDELTKPALDQKEKATGDHSDWHFSAMPTPRVQRDGFGFEEIDAKDTEGEVATFSGATLLETGEPVDHGALRPLFRPLGIPLGDMSTEDAQRILSEIGMSLRKTLEGLNRMYRGPHGNHGHFHLSKLRLLALEDNPIQFCDDADQALNAFFSSRRQVHLSAPSALEETMDHLIAHQGVSEHAIDEALSILLSALSPAALQKRFREYAQDDRPLNQDEMDAWCWNMYKAYFSELSSEKQRGLKMLFWEAFAQEYQQDMRRRERERYISGGDEV